MSSFTAEVADRADCGILLDLHNIYCNDRKGRQPMSEFGIVGVLSLL